MVISVMPTHSATDAFLLPRGEAVFACTVTKKDNNYRPWISVMPFMLQRWVVCHCWQNYLPEG